MLARLEFYAPGPIDVVGQFTNLLLPAELALLGDDAGNPIEGVTIRNASVALPEPPTVLLVALAALGAVAAGIRGGRARPGRGNRAASAPRAA